MLESSSPLWKVTTICTGWVVSTCTRQSFSGCAIRSPIVAPVQRTETSPPVTLMVLSTGVGAGGAVVVAVAAVVVGVAGVGGVGAAIGFGVAQGNGMAGSDGVSIGFGVTGGFPFAAGIAGSLPRVGGGSGTGESALRLV